MKPRRLDYQERTRRARPSRWAFSPGAIGRDALVASVLTCLLAAGTLSSEDFKLTAGAEYKNVKVSRVEPDGLIVATDYGVVKLFFAELPKEVQEKYHYDAKAAEAFRFRLDAARDAAKE